MDQAEFASLLGVSLGTIKAIDSGATRCSPHLAAKAEFVFGLDRNAVMGGKDARDIFGGPYTRQSYAAWKNVNALTEGEAADIKERTLKRVGLVIEAANSAQKTISLLAILEEMLTRAANDLKLQDKLIAAYGKLPKGERISLANSTFEEVKGVLLRRMAEAKAPVKS